MDRIELLVDQVISAFAGRRRSGFRATGPSLTVPGAEMEPWRERIEARVRAFRHSVIDRAALLGRARRRFGGADWSADFAGVADELQEMAREELRTHLVDNGMAAEVAGRVAAGFSIGALLHEG